jgi:hypothetical protein
MHLASYLGLLHLAELKLARAYLEVTGAHGDEPDVAVLCRGSPTRAPPTPTPWPPSSSATARTGPKSPSGCTRSCSAAPAVVGLGCCATCTTCT